jgi:hypothetical protein
MGDEKDRKILLLEKGSITGVSFAQNTPLSIRSIS